MSASRTRVIFTGAPGALTGLAASVEAEGAQFTEWPLISFAAPADPVPLGEALRQLGRFTAVCLTSPRAAASVAAVIRRDAIELERAPVLWTSSACATALESLFPRVEVVPLEHGTGSLGVAIASAMLTAGVGTPVLFPCGDRHREELVHHLRAAGREVHVVEAYRTMLASPSRAAAVMASADILVVTSPGVATLLASVQGRERPALVAIGRTTAHEATRHGWAPDAVASAPVAPAVAAAINSLLPSYS